jgi:MFS family permease
MTQRRWLRIIPVALVMYTISYVDRTNISLALDPGISTMMKDLLMDPKMKGEVMGFFFFGYMVLQIPGGYWATRWGARRIVSVFLVTWGLCAVGCGLSRTFTQLAVMRFLLGVAESGVFPATLVLLANWFPRAERARANAYWILCQPLAVVGSALINGWLLGFISWRQLLVFEGALPFVWLPVWWFLIRDHPREAAWVAPEERDFLETTLQREHKELEPLGKLSLWAKLGEPALFVMVVMYFFQNCEAYGCMTFLTEGLKDKGFSPWQHGVLFAVPYGVAAIMMVLNSWHSDKTRERRAHVAVVYGLSGASLILSVALSRHFWVSYAFMCLAIQGPFSGQAAFWAIPSETLPRGLVGVVIGLVNAFGNVGGYVGPFFVGWLVKEYHSTAIPFKALGAGMLVAAGLAFLLPKAASAPAPLRAIPGTTPEQSRELRR